MPRAGLTPGRVLEEAELLADEVGLAQLTLARVADRLGVRMPSLYKHVESLGHVQAELGVRARHQLARALATASVGRSGDDALRTVARAYRAWATRFPGRYAATVRAPDPAQPDSMAASAEVYDVVAAVLKPLALTSESEVDAIRFLRASLHGFITLEQSGGFGIPRDVDRSFDRLVDGLVLAMNSACFAPVGDKVVSGA